MMLRIDLMDLGTDALMALANPGFVKRAQKDVAAGTLPSLHQDVDGTVHALFDDAVRTSMGPDVSLRDAVCSCTASGMCRHRVTLVLAYQASNAGVANSAAADADVVLDSEPTSWSPARFDDAVIAAAVTPQVLEQARKLALERPVATVISGSVPAVYLPMSQVRFFSSTGLAHARCDCQLGIGCAHVVLAVWAFRQAQETHPGVAEVTLEVRPFGVGMLDAPSALMGTETAIRVQQQVQDWLWSLWRDGASQPLLGLEARYEALMADLSQLGWTWVREELDTMWQILQALARRSNRFDMDDLVRASAQLCLRLQGAAHADGASGPRVPASQILGIGQQGEVALDLLRLISLGMECWRDDSSEGASIIFADPDTQAACVLERAWPRSADDSIDSLLNRRVAGYPLRLLGAGQIVTKAAKRRANASLELGSKAQHTSVLALSPKAWDDLLAPIRFDTLYALLQHLRSRPPAGIRSGEAGGNWHVVDLTELTLDDWAWDGAQQTLFARWYDAGQIALSANLAYQGLTPGAVDALARALNGEWGAVRAIAGPVWREQGGVAIRPMSVLTEQRAVVLALEPKAPQAMTLQEMPMAASANQAMLRESLYLLGQLMRQGLRHAPPSLRSRLGAQAAQLDEAGYAHVARLMRGAFAEQRDGAGLASLSGLTLLLGTLMN
jgi:hypothetical protein